MCQACGAANVANPSAGVWCAAPLVLFQDTEERRQFRLRQQGLGTRVHACCVTSAERLATYVNKLSHMRADLSWVQIYMLCIVRRRVLH